MKKIILVLLAVLIMLSMVGVLWACRLNININPGQKSGEKTEERQEEQKKSEDPGSHMPAVPARHNPYPEGPPENRD